MNFVQFLSILRARWLVVLAVLVATIAVTLAVSLMMPRQYTATSSVVVDVKPDPVSAMLYPGLASPAFMATQIDIIQSDRVALRVIKDLKLTSNESVRRQWEEAGGQGSFEQWLVELVQRKLSVRPSRESNVINIDYQAPDPRFAAGLANAFAQAYISTTLELKVDPARQYTAFFDGRTKEAREALEKAQAKLSAFQREKGIIATDERLDVENQRLNELSSQLVAIQAVAAESSSRQSQARGSSGEQLAEVLNNPVVANLKVDLNRAEAKLKELGVRYGDRHPQVIEARANAQELRSRIAAETSRITSGVGVTATINKQRESQVRAELDAQRAKMLQMKAVRDAGMVLVRDVESAQRTYDSLMTRLNQTSLESQTTQSYANVLTTAAPPSRHSSPKVPLNVALSVVLGLLLAIGSAVLLELRDRRVRSTTDLVQGLGLPVIGVLPKPNAKRLAGGRRIAHMPHRIVGLPAPIRRA